MNKLRPINLIINDLSTSKDNVVVLHAYIRAEMELAQKTKSHGFTN